MAADWQDEEIQRKKDRMRGLKDKRVLVTGGAGGIGAATVARFLEEGAHVVALDRDVDALDRLKPDYATLSGVIVADVADPDDVDRAFGELDHLLGGLDILINNAGISLRHRFLDISPLEWWSVMNVNLDGVFFVAQRAARRMLGAAGGVILNIIGLPLLRGL
jgi:meso-butanediol dehydrogenase/(S,S)-butanediol dehydrogenase/diacetyl reductase